MTGFGRHAWSQGDFSLLVEFSGVNRKQLDLAIFLPSDLLELEPEIRKSLSVHFERGRVQARLTIESAVGASASELVFDAGRAAAYLEHLRDFAENVGIKLAEVSMNDFIAAPGVFVETERRRDVDDLRESVLEGFRMAAADFIRMQEVEGQALAADLQARLDSLAELVRAMSERAPIVVENYASQLKRRLEEIAAEVPQGTGEDEALLRREMLVFADRSDISEELTRLHSHLGQFRALLDKGGAPGRKLDFLCQELSRECNTVASKANDAELAQLVVNAKVEVEKIREQAQNIQ